uniref:CASP8 and FADD-like apoptosis regulator isoform X2 n=1 Tax=Doryrhamphus excisus TaxID=161450 RepID=UPI0025AE528B|nr:CASP8 and FADD-like apoptosis regulator isoform X2 [Doryrhamphus excisus]XP_057938688.1 CASP8 and FADD-like apoptosis regulator isoform X2 [Doryrhamphus excisus]
MPTLVASQANGNSYATTSIRMAARMAVPDKQMLQTIHEISEALGSDERKTVFYLCGTSETNNTATCLKETLKSKAMSYDKGGQFLAELLVHLRRYDILRLVFGCSRDEVERTLRSGQVLPEFRVLMTHLSEDMTSGDVNNVKFLLSTILPREKMEQAKNFLDLAIELEHLDKISSERVGFLEECLVHIGRIDLANKLKVYKISGNTQVCEHNVQQSCQSPLTKYKFTRGVCIIIDCVGNDGEMLERTFTSLHFNVTLHKWLTVAETVSVLRGLFRGTKDDGADGFVCCIISRGTATHLLATDSYGEGLRLEDLRRRFVGDMCSVLVGKPKVFFIQMYNVLESQHCASVEHRDEDLETDGRLSPDSIPSDADMLWSHCLTGEHQLQQGQHRSIYLKALTDALHKGKERNRHVVDLHVEVNAAVFEHNRRHPGDKYHIDLKHTLRKDLYL